MNLPQLILILPGCQERHQSSCSASPFSEAGAEQKKKKEKKEESSLNKSREKKPKKMGVGASAQEQMQNTLFQLKFTAKNLVRESAKCTKREKVQKKKLKKVVFL